MTCFLVVNFVHQAIKPRLSNTWIVLTFSRRFCWNSVPRRFSLWQNIRQRFSSEMVCRNIWFSRCKVALVILQLQRHAHIGIYCYPTSLHCCKRVVVSTADDIKDDVMSGQHIRVWLVQVFDGYFKIPAELGIVLVHHGDCNTQLTGSRLWKLQLRQRSVLWKPPGPLVYPHTTHVK